MSEPSAVGPLLAWQFDLGDDRRDGVQVVFARSQGRAMIYAGQQSGGGKGDRTDVTRAPAFDKYVSAETRPGANPETADFWNEGYEVTCSECEHMIGSDPCDTCAENFVEGEYDDDGEPVPRDREATEDEIVAYVSAPLAHKGNVYCNERCLKLETDRWARRKLRKAEARAGLLARFPFVIPKSANVGGTGECRGRPEDGFHAHHPSEKYQQQPRKKTCFDVDRDNVYVTFAVPGGVLSEKTREGNHYHNSYCHRCGHAWIARGDYEAFRCLKAAPGGDGRPELAKDHAAPTG